jgi:hypothetical protein
MLLNWTNSSLYTLIFLFKILSTDEQQLNPAQDWNNFWCGGKDFLKDLIATQKKPTDTGLSSIRVIALKYDILLTVQKLASYVPKLLQRRLYLNQTQVNPPGTSLRKHSIHPSHSSSSEIEHFPACVVFADISGKYLIANIFCGYMLLLHSDSVVFTRILSNKIFYIVLIRH